MKRVRAVKRSFTDFKRIIWHPKELLKAFPYKEGYSLYIGIPFCPSTCLYCSFTSYSIDQFENIVQDYLEALLKELDFVAKTYAHKELQTMYIGGGTPTSLKEEDLEYLLYEVNKRFPFSKIQEITVEAGRPDSLNFKDSKEIWCDKDQYQSTVNER